MRLLLPFLEKKISSCQESLLHLDPNDTTISLPTSAILPPNPPPGYLNLIEPVSTSTFQGWQK